MFSCDMTPDLLVILPRQQAWLLYLSLSARFRRVTINEQTTKFFSTHLDLFSNTHGPVAHQTTHPSTNLAKRDYCARDDVNQFWNLHRRLGCRSAWPTHKPDATFHPIRTSRAVMASAVCGTPAGAIRWTCIDLCSSPADTGTDINIDTDAACLPLPLL
jgi:hypothetical protein